MKLKGCFNCARSAPIIDDNKTVVFCNIACLEDWLRSTTRSDKWQRIIEK
jgi:hypothetical protein